MINNIGIRANVKGTFRNALTGEVTDSFEGKNLVVDVGLLSIVSRLAGLDTPANKRGTITYCAVGTVNTAVSPDDIKLADELFRKQISVRYYAGTTATFTTFFNTSEANGTLTEIGLFGDDATVTADSGTLFCRLIINKVKTTSETLSLEWDITISAS